MVDDLDDLKADADETVDDDEDCTENEAHL